MLPLSALLSSLTSAGLWAASGGGMQGLLKAGMHPVAAMLIRLVCEVVLVLAVGVVLSLLGKASWFGSTQGVPAQKLANGSLGWLAHVPRGTWHLMLMVVCVDIVAYLLYYRLLANHVGHVVMALTMTAPLLLAAYRMATGATVTGWEWLGLLLIVAGVVIVSLKSG